jgi:hypothetical protein
MLISMDGSAGKKKNVKWSKEDNSKAERRGYPGERRSSLKHFKTPFIQTQIHPRLRRFKARRCRCDA